MTSAYFRLILREFGGRPDERRALLEGTESRRGEQVGAAPEIELGQQLRQIRNANRLLGPDWALAMGARLHAATHGPIGVGALSAPTVREGIEVLTRFSQVRAPHFRLRAFAVGSEVRLVPQDRIELDAAERRSLLDIVLLSTQALIESILGRRMSEARFEISYDAPEDRSFHASCFHAPTSFGHRESAVLIPSKWLDLECPLADPPLHQTALRVLVAGERRLGGDRALAARLEQLLAERGTRLRVTAVARLLGVSSRTLARRLREDGTSYRRLLEAAQKNAARALLAEPDLSVAQIADALGYDEPANFGRAFRRWFGTSPGLARPRLLERESRRRREEPPAPTGTRVKRR
jgi:AraC-like DNA-binding protein